MGYYKRLCPVCWQPAQPTQHRAIWPHMDSLGFALCPGSDQPYTITLRDDPGQFVRIKRGSRRVTRHLRVVA